MTSTYNPDYVYALETTYLADTKVPRYSVHSFEDEGFRDAWVSKKKTLQANAVTSTKSKRSKIETGEEVQKYLDIIDGESRYGANVCHHVFAGARDAKNPKKRKTGGNADGKSRSHRAGQPLFERWPYLKAKLSIPENSRIDLDQLFSTVAIPVNFHCDECDKLHSTTVKAIAAHCREAGEGEARLLCAGCLRKVRGAR